MKTIKFLASALLVGAIAVSTVSATDVVKSSEVSVAEKSVKKQVSKIVSGISTEETGSVVVYFSLSSKGFDLLKVEGENSTLVNEVSLALKKKAVNAPAVLEGTYKVTVRFADSYDSKYYATERDSKSKGNI